MIYQWYLFAALFGIYVFAHMAVQNDWIEIAGEREKRVKWFPVLVLIAILSYVAGTREQTGDTGAYVMMLNRSASTLDALPGIIFGPGKDKGFTVFMVLFRYFIGYKKVIFFTVIAAFSLLCVCAVYRKHSCNFFISMFLFLASGDYQQWTHNGMRQFIAVAICFAGTNLLLKKKYIRYILVVLLASTFHATALMMIPMCFVVQGKPWNARTALYTLAVVVAVNSVDTLTDLLTNLMESTQYSDTVDMFNSTDGTNVLRVLVFMVPPLLALVYRQRLLHADVPIINLAVGMSIASMGMYIMSMFTSGVIIGRLPIYFSLYNYILLPSIIDRVFERRSANLVYLILIGCYMVFYHVQTGHL